MALGKGFMEKLNVHIESGGVAKRVDPAEISIENIEDVNYKISHEKDHHRKSMRDKINYEK